MVYNLVAKYGLIPQSLYPDSFSATASSTLNSIIFTKLREDALVLRNLLSSPSTSATAVSNAKAEMLREIHTILTLTLGPPPSPSEPFNWDFTDTSGKARTVRTTPQRFAQDIWSPNFRITSAAAGQGGWFGMGDSWMDEFVYQAVVDPSVLREEVKKVLDGEPVVLPLWDPMGSLA
ncbi:peptidase C1-like family-domain-containing protein [Chaetomium strumarium]|uniref:Peptidase C1-like family-domain-containing protein n=1 Tax=Chaetomium strumarium TaxID=1170767 RepID=A0AAJ0H2Z2_9PEZI|nr:peptidase C1-like family-domain-containing protein [Chaetomium strumarium]